MGNHFRTVNADSIGWLTEAEMVEVDRVMIEELHIELKQMMENAGRALSLVVRELSNPARIVVAAGSGGNGGGGLVAARHLANAGFDVAVASIRPKAEMSSVPAHQLDVLERMGVPVVRTTKGADLVIDALIGYSLVGAPQGEAARLISELAECDTVISLDTPSGLDVTTGNTPGAVVRADATVTLAAPKVGLRDSPHVGDLYVADISVPPTVIREFAVPARFPAQGVLRITFDDGPESAIR